MYVDKNAFPFSPIGFAKCRCMVTVRQQGYRTRWSWRALSWRGYRWCMRIRSVTWAKPSWTSRSWRRSRRWVGRSIIWPLEELPVLHTSIHTDILGIHVYLFIAFDTHILVHVYVYGWYRNMIIFTIYNDTV